MPCGTRRERDDHHCAGSQGGPVLGAQGRHREGHRGTRSGSAPEPPLPGHHGPAGQGAGQHRPGSADLAARGIPPAGTSGRTVQDREPQGRLAGQEHPGYGDPCDPEQPDRGRGADRSGPVPLGQCPAGKRAEHAGLHGLHRGDYAATWGSSISTRTGMERLVEITRQLEKAERLSR